LALLIKSSLLDDIHILFSPMAERCLITKDLITKSKISSIFKVLNHIGHNKEHDQNPALNRNKFFLFRDNYHLTKAYNENGIEIIRCSNSIDQGEFTIDFESRRGKVSP
jgi:hypothetical protein